MSILVCGEIFDEKFNKTKQNNKKKQGRPEGRKEGTAGRTDVNQYIPTIFQSGGIKMSANGIFPETGVWGWRESITTVSFLLSQHFE